MDKIRLLFLGTHDRFITSKEYMGNLPLSTSLMYFVLISCMYFQKDLSLVSLSRQISGPCKVVFDSSLMKILVYCGLF